MQDLQQLISRLYRAGVGVPVDQFQQWALEQLRPLVPHDAAVWGMGNRERRQFHNVKVFGAPFAFAECLQSTVADNPIFPLLERNIGKPVDMSDAISDRRFYRSNIYKNCFARFGVERILSSVHADDRSGLYTLLSIYRFDRKQTFTAREKTIYATALFHLIAAYAHAFFMHLDRPRGAQSDRVAAVVDREGVLHEVQSEFLDLLEQRYPGYRGMRLPFAFKPGREQYQVDGLCVRVKPLADVFVVRIWEETALDRLTQRERQVVTAVCRGLSHKEVGRELGLAPTTVSSHLYRAYSKLGVESRSALAKLVHGLN